jgi:hypothetical protein
MVEIDENVCFGFFFKNGAQYVKIPIIIKPERIMSVAFAFGPILFLVFGFCTCRKKDARPGF